MRSLCARSIQVLQLGEDHAHAVEGAFTRLVGAECLVELLSVCIPHLTHGLPSSVWITRAQHLNLEDGLEEVAVRLRSSPLRWVGNACGEVPGARQWVGEYAFGLVY